MTDFNIGDRVVYHHTADGDAAHNGQTGVIEQIFNNVYGDPYAWVKWDVTSTAPSHPFLHNLVLTGPTLSVAATLRAQADALDAEAREARKERSDLMDRVWTLDDKAANATYLAAQYRNVATDLEARS